MSRNNGFNSIDDILFDNEFELIDDKKKKPPLPPDSNDRLTSSFQEINNFYETHNREPNLLHSDISESQLYFRLESIRENPEKILLLDSHDKYSLLNVKPKEINSIEDIFNDDSLDILEDNSEGLFDFKHTPKNIERTSTDFVSRRKPCKNFNSYISLFQKVQKDLKNRSINLIDFNENQLNEGNFFIHNGILLLLEKIIAPQKDKFGKMDGRTKIIFENGTESNMKLRSLGKNLFANGQGVTSNFATESFIIDEADNESGYIYVLKSNSTDEKISSINDLYKIGFSKNNVKDRIKNAENEPTYLMSSVSIVSTYQCYNMNTQKFEQILHNFFGSSCLNIDVYDHKKNRHSPREWFIVPLNIIEQAIDLIINGDIVNYKYDEYSSTIIS